MTHPMYNDRLSMGEVNQNFFDPRRATEYPKGLYKGVALPKPEYVACSNPRDTSIDYIYQVERQTHPDHFSRYSYTNFPFEHGPMQPGRFVTPPNMQWMTQPPPDMAPKQFYQGKYADPNYCSSQAYIDAWNGRNHPVM